METTTSFLLSDGASVATKMLLHLAVPPYWTSHGLAIQRVHVNQARTRTGAASFQNPAARGSAHAACMMPAPASQGCTSTHAAPARRRLNEDDGHLVVSLRLTPAIGARIHPGFGFPWPPMWCSHGAGIPNSVVTCHQQQQKLAQP